MWDCIVTSFALFLSSSDVNPGAPKRPSGARKRPGVRTSENRTCCQNLSRDRLWKAETVLEKQSFFFNMFLDFTRWIYRSPNRSYNQQSPKGDPGSQRPNPSLEWRISIFRQCLEASTWGGPAWPWNLPLNITLIQKDPKRWTESAEAEGAQQWAVLRENSFRTLEDKQCPADCWPWKVPIVGSVGMNGHGSPNQQPLLDMPQSHVNRYSERSKSIIFAHDCLCDP